MQRNCTALATNDYPRRPRDIARGPAGLDLFIMIGKAAIRDGRAHARHKILIIPEVHPGQQHRPERFLGAHEVMQIGARIIASGRAIALLIERARIIRMARIAQVDLATPVYARP